MTHSTCWTLFSFHPTFLGSPAVRSGRDFAFEDDFLSTTTIPAQWATLKKAGGEVLECGKRRREGGSGPLRTEEGGGLPKTEDPFETRIRVGT